MIAIKRPFVDICGAAVKFGTTPLIVTNIIFGSIHHQLVNKGIIPLTTTSVINLTSLKSLLSGRISTNDMIVTAARNRQNVYKHRNLSMMNNKHKRGKRYSRHDPAKQGKRFRTLAQNIMYHRYNLYSKRSLNDRLNRYKLSGEVYTVPHLESVDSVLVC
jgi:hypothetical protein